MNRMLSRTLYWDGCRGLATYATNVVCELTQPPQLNGRAVLRIDYMPLCGLWGVQESDAAAGWRDLTEAECADIDLRLARMVNMLRAVWS
jgi:hypothetical protein